MFDYVHVWVIIINTTVFLHLYSDLMLPSESSQLVSESGHINGVKQCQTLADWTLTSWRTAHRKMSLKKNYSHSGERFCV